MIAKLTAIVAFALSLLGFQFGGTTWSNRITGDHGDALYSKAWAKDGRASFKCVESSTGNADFHLVRDPGHATGVSGEQHRRGDRQQAQATHPGVGIDAMGGGRLGAGLERVGVQGGHGR